MALPLSVIAVPLTGLQTKADPKSAPVGLLTVADNLFASRRTDGGGLELRKRFGFTSKTKNINGGGTIGTGRNLGVLNDELVLCDGLKAYSLSLVLDKWIPRGRAQHLACDVRTISGDVGIKKPNVGSATAGGYTVYVSAPTSLTGPSGIYVKDNSTGEVLAASTGLASAFRMKVVAVGSDFYVFSWNGVNNIECIKISGSTPTTIPSVSTVVATNVDPGEGMFDVIVNPQTSEMVLAYVNTTPGLTVKTWTTGMAAGTSATTAVVPVGALGWLRHDAANGKEYLGYTTLTEVHLLEVNSTTLAGGTNTTIETVSSVDMPQIGGYRTASSSKSNLLWTVGTGQTSKIRAACKPDASGASTFDVMLSVGLASNPFKIGSLWYVVAAYQTSGTEFSTNPSQYGQRRTFLLELAEDGVGAAGSNGLAGYLMANDSGGLPRARACLPSVSSLSGTKVVFGSAALSSVTPPEATAQVSHWKIVDLTLDWSGAGLGRPVVYGGVLHLPGAAPRFYDGHFLVETGFWVLPEEPDVTSQTTGGSLELEGVYQYCYVFARTTKAGRRDRSAPGPITTVTLTGSNNKVVLSLPTLRVTETDARYNTNPEVTEGRLELYRTQAGLPNFYLLAVLENNALADTVSYDDILSDDNLELNEILYTTGGAVDHVPPPAVKVYHPHGNRLFAICGDQSIWHSNLLTEEVGVEFSDDFRFTIEEGEGAPVAMATIDTTLAIFKAERTLLLQGAGPDEKGVGEYAAPQALQDDVGAAVLTGTGAPAGVIPVSGGALVRSGKSWFLLGRDLAYQPVEPPAGYDSLTPGFGAPVGGAPTGRPLVVIPTDGAALVYDWQFQQFYTWSGAANFLAGVSSARWRNGLVILKSDGSVLQEVAAQYFDGSSDAIAMTAEIAWLELNSARVYQALVTIEAKATTSVTTTFYQDRDDAAGSSKSVNVTTAWKDPIVHAPVGGDCAQGKLRIAESSTTEGIRVTKLDLEVGLRSGVQKRRAAAYAG
jgi:hypothetical protein